MTTNINGEKAFEEVDSNLEKDRRKGQLRSRIENPHMGIMGINDNLDREERQEKVCFWRASVENFKADLEKWQRGEKPLYDFLSMDELRTAIEHLQSSIDRLERLDRPEKVHKTDTLPGDGYKK